MSCRSADLRTFGFTTREFSMVDGYTNNLEKSQNVKIWGGGGGGLARVWALARDNTVNVHVNLFLVRGE